jgi:transcriptional regulator with XRE-family HTH domain
MQANNSILEAPPKVGQEIQRLRLLNNLTLEQLASKSGVSKSILSQIERDRSNPTLATIWRITKALESQLEDVLAVKEGTKCFEKLSQNATPEVTSEDSQFRLRILGILSTVASVQWYEFTAEPGAELVSEAHGNGSIENVTLCKGNLCVIVGDETQSICTGETLRFRTDVPHRLKNEGEVVAHGFMVNLL